MSVLSNGVSQFVNSQLPEFIRSNDPNFVAFLRAYYKWLEDSNQGSVIYNIKNLLNYREIDTTTDQFIQFFKNDFLPFFPKDIALDPVKLLKNSAKFYQKKGSPESLAFLFRVLYDLDIEIYYPKQQTLKLSDGKWQLPQAIKLVLPEMGFDIQQLVGRLGTGSISNTTCVIESASVALDPTLNREIIELFISNVSANFTPGDSIIINYGIDALGNVLVFEQKIIGSISSIIVDPNNQGLGYVGTIFNGDGSIAYQGNPVSIIGGTSNDVTAIEAVAYVGNVTTGSLTSVTILNGGYGFQLDPNTEIIVTDPSGNGNGAVVIVDGVDSSNQIQITINTDSIDFKQNVTLGSANYGFSNIAVSNVNTAIGNALSYITLNVAPIQHMNVINGGSGYQSVPQIQLESVYETDLSSSLHSAYIIAPTPTNLANWLANRQGVQDLGKIAAVRILNGGSGYSNVTDVISVDSSIGYGATFNFITGANGTITRVIVTNGGAGYSNVIPPLYVVNSANQLANSAGTGAILQGFGYSSGEVLSLSVSEIGRILDIRLVDRGFDYVSTPLVSLRNQDITIQPISNNQFYLQGEYVFQGTNVNTSSYLAFVDGYDRANSILRVYNYIGSLNVNQSLISANQNATIISANTYGNGKARANAQFLGGLIDFPGFWLNTDGQLSADQHLEDGETYHNYSYVVKVEKALAEYKSTLMNIVHPAGMKLLAIDTVTDFKSDIIGNESEPIQTMNTANIIGTISINAFGNGTVTGNGTHFTNFTNGSLLLISSGTIRLQAKQIVNITNDTSLIVESNTLYFASDTLQTTNGSNVVFSSGDTSNLAANDIIQTNISGNAQTSIVINANDGNGRIQLNTTFTTNATNIHYVVYPTMNAVNYNILLPG